MWNNKELCSNRTQNDLRSEQSGFPWNDDGKPSYDQQYRGNDEVAETKLRRQSQNYAVRHHQRNGRWHHFGREAAIQHLQYGLLFIFNIDNNISNINFGSIQVMTVNGAIMMKEPIVVKDDVIVYRLNSVILSSFTSGQNMMAVLEMNKDRFSTLIRCIQDTGLTDTLTKGTQFNRHFN